MRYFRFETRGFENLHRPTSLIVGYHGGPWALDIFMLSAKIHDEFGLLPRAIFLETWGWLPVLRDMVMALDGLYGEPDDAALAEMRRRGQHLVVLPGGTREALRPFWGTGSVDFGRRRGYLRLALRHGLDIVPVAASGLDATFVGLNDGYKTSQRIFGHGKIPLWLGVGAIGLWPFALPWRTRIVQRIGTPIDVGAVVREHSDEGQQEAFERAHARVTGAIQQMLNELRSERRMR
jgi:1-acyl-sn-glycerol-3-phosphate acyltransferase